MRTLTPGEFPLYDPLRPDLADVDGGFTLRAATCGAGCAFMSVGSGARGALFRLDEKSGIPRGPFFFMETSRHGWRVTIYFLQRYCMATSEKEPLKVVP